MKKRSISLLGETLLPRYLRIEGSIVERAMHAGIVAGRLSRSSDRAAIRSSQDLSGAASHARQRLVLAALRGRGLLTEGCFYCFASKNLVKTCRPLHG